VTEKRCQTPLSSIRTLRVMEEPPYFLPPQISAARVLA